MISKTGKLILIAHITLFAFLGGRTNCIALPVDLGTAGSGYWTVLGVGAGTVNSQGEVIGNVGVAQNGQARLDAIAASAAAGGLTPTSTLNQINLKRTTLTLAPGTYNLTSFQLKRATLTLSGSGSFVFNISSSFALKSGQVLLDGGATEANVLFNYTGTSDVGFSKKGTSVLHGIILALNAKVNLAAGLVVGEIISGNDISVSSGARVRNVALSGTGNFSVPEGTSTFALSLIALCSLVAFRSFVANRSSRRTEPCR
jgi:ice-binding like protein/putative adhesin